MRTRLPSPCRNKGHNHKRGRICIRAKPQAEVISEYESDPIAVFGL